MIYKSFEFKLSRKIFSFKRIKGDFCLPDLIDVRPVRGAVFGLFGSKFGSVKRAVCVFTHEQLVTPFKTQIGSPGVKDGRKIYRPTDCRELSSIGWDSHLKISLDFHFFLNYSEYFSSLIFI